MSPAPERLGFEIRDINDAWEFIPNFYPGTLRQNKPKKLNRNATQCTGESVSIKALKNRDVHVKGLILRNEVSKFNTLLDHHGKVNLISPLVPGDGLECIIKEGELGEQEGWNPTAQEWMFNYSVDLVSTGRDEVGSTQNTIVTAINATTPSP